RRKFDQIVAFAEIEKFIDTPLKHHSTGMCARLAFAVALHLESEILLVDEILALADQTFQKKCFEKMMAAVAKGGVVLFVNHDPECVRRFCNRGIVFAGGRIVNAGTASAAADYYQWISTSRFQEHASVGAEDSNVLTGAIQAG